MTALCLAVSLLLPSPVFALRLPQPEDRRRRAGMEEDLQEVPPDPALLAFLSGLAWTFTRNYQLTLVPWKPLPELANDWPQWRLIPEKGFFQYVPEDLRRLPREASVGLLLEAVVLASTFDPKIVEEEYRTQGTFWALITALAIPRSRDLFLQKYPGMNSDFSLLDQELYRPVDQAILPPQTSAFLQFLEGILYEGRREKEHSRITHPRVLEALEETRPLRLEMKRFELKLFYETARDRIWPVALRMLEEDMNQELFRRLQKEKGFRTELGLSRRQKLYAVEGRLLFQELSERQRTRFRQGLESHLPRISEEEILSLRRSLQLRLAEGLRRMRDQIPSGLLPPLEEEIFPPETGGILGAQRRILSRAGAAGRYSQGMVLQLDKMITHAGAEEDWATLAWMAEKFHQEMGALREEAGQASRGTGLLLERLRSLREEDLPGVQQVRELTSQLHQGNHAIDVDAQNLEADAGSFLERMPDGQGNLKKLAKRARELHSRSLALRATLSLLQSQAEEAELTALDLMSEGARAAASRTRVGRVQQAAQAIAQWADPDLLRRKAMSEAIAQTLLRSLQRLRHLQERADGSEPLEKSVEEALRKEFEELSKKLREIMERFGISPELQEEWIREASRLVVSDLQGQLVETLKQLGSAGGGQGSSQELSPYSLLGADLLKVVPPAAPPERPASAPAEAAEAGPLGPLSHPVAASSDLNSRQAEARLYQQLAQRQRAGTVQAQIPLYRKYKKLRLSLISTASAQLFQWGAMKQRPKTLTDLLNADDLDEDNLPLVRTGTSRIFMEEEGGRKKAEGDVLSILVDVSGSMLGPGDPKQNYAEAERNGTRRIDHVLDLLVTLGEAAAKQSRQKLQISIFSSWWDGVSRVVKRADEPWSELKAAEVIDQVLNSSHDGTRDAQAVMEEMDRLRAITGPRAKKTIWVLSDGDGTGEKVMQEVLRKNKEITVFGWGLGPGMESIKKTFGSRGIWVARMSELVQTGMRVFQQQARGPAKPKAGMEEAAEGLQLGLDGWPLDFPRLHPIQDRPGAGELKFLQDGDGTRFEVDGIRIDPPASPKVTLSPWAVSKLQVMWDIYRMHPKGRSNTLLLYGQAGIGKSLYLRYLWEIYRAWLRGRAERMGPGLEKLKEQVLALADRTQTRVITFHEKLRKADLTQRLSFGEAKVDENGWTSSDLVDGGVSGDQVILSEVNRAPDEILSELDEPLEEGKKTLHGQVARFHPNSRFVAAINPAEGQVSYTVGYAGRHLSGQFLGHFWKITLDYPRLKLEDGTTDNPEYALFVEHENQVLREVRKRKLEDGRWAVPDEVIAKLVVLAGLVREDALAGQAPFIMTTRALVRMVEKLDRFPHLLDQIPDVFFNSYWVDDTVHGAGTRAHLAALIERIFKPANWPAGQPWPAPRAPVGPPQVVDGKVTYPHWPADVRIPRGSGTGSLIPQEILFPTQGNLWKLEDLLMDVALERNILNMGDTDTGQSYFMRLLAKVLRRNLILLTLSQGFKVRDMLVMRWFAGGKTQWLDSLALSHLRPEKVLAEGPPIVLWDRGEKGDPGTLVAFNDFLQERRVLLPSGEEFILPEGSIIAMNRTPPRAPYEYETHSGEFFDRFSHHAYSYPPPKEETEILHAHHPQLARDSVSKVVLAANQLRGLYQSQELFEPPGVGMTFSAVARLAQYPDRQVMLPDLMVEAYGPIHEGAAAAIRKALEAAGLNVPVHPLWDPALIYLKGNLPHVQWDPEVQNDPALWRLAQGLTSQRVKQVLETGEPVQIGWGLQLRRINETITELVPLEAGLRRPFIAYAQLGTVLRRAAVKKGISAYRLSEEGIFYKTIETENWERLDLEVELNANTAGLWEFLSSRGFKNGMTLTLELPVDPQAAWVDLYWALDPVTLRRSIPPARRLQGLSRPIRLKVNGERLLNHLRGFVVGLDHSVSPGFLIRPNAAGAEEDAAALIRRIPVITGFISHGDDKESLKMLGEWKEKLNDFLQQHPTVKHLVIVQEIGAPFLGRVLRAEGVEPGQLIAAGRRDPEGFERVVRPAFEQAMKIVWEITDGWWSRIYTGQFPEIPDQPWHRELFNIIYGLRQSGYEIHAVVERPAVEDWWKFLLYEDAALSVTQNLSGPQADPAERQKMVEALISRGTATQARDEMIVNRQMIPLLEEVFGEEEPEDLKGEPLKPEEMAVIMPRGRAHALRVEPLLKARFAEVAVFRSEDLVEWKPFPELEYEEALIRSGRPPGQAPAEVEQLLDDQIALEWREIEKARAAAAQQEEAGAEEAGRLVILTPATAEILNQLTSLKGGLPLRVAVVVQDDAQEAWLRAGVEEAGALPVLWRVTNLSRTGQTLPAAIQSLRAEAAESSFGVWVVERYNQLLGLGRFLKIPGVSFRAWLERVQRRLEREA